ncbi:hypothetical protein KFL_002570130 [Klebsormidium nitens]|uniref:Uncharacterized protein n=1 Tax=Klebsormidium nitens TaxID=105231 RepID=A0A1Y1I4I3_KLENI|nr:hypothetical protein KFL_002570130 [Klebsormidium nitens]|eukprot:GAQ85845.1 hypothetical protein KFL_002570130 [Klebsormidium nitens]
MNPCAENDACDHFMTDIQNPLLEAGFARRTIKEVVQRYRLFTKRGYPKRRWGMCFGSMEDANATWAEYQGLRADLLERCIIIEKCNPKKAGPAPAPVINVVEHVNTATENTRAIAEAAAAELAARAENAPGQMNQMDLMQDIAALVYQRFLKRKNPE